MAVVIGFALTFGFFFLRVVSLALCLSFLVEGAPLARQLRLETELWLGFSVIFILWALSTFWFVLMAKGLSRLISKRKRMASIESSCQ